MNSDQDSPGSKPGGLPGEPTMVEVSESVGSVGRVMATYSYSFEVDPWFQSFSFEHDKEKRVFRLTDAEEKVEYFRDNPVRYLVVEPDLETGQMRPAVQHGKPKFIYLCREDREV